MLLDVPLPIGSYLLISAISLAAGLWLDKWLGEPKRYHPLVGFGLLAKKCECWCRSISFLNKRTQGVVAWCLCVLPLTWFSYWLLSSLIQFSLVLALMFNVFILYLTIGGKSLIEHADKIYQPLKRGDIDDARYQVSMIVSRNTEKMGEKEISSSTIESVLENGNDAVFGPMIWFVIFGAPGAVLFRLANTLDAMWGYKNEKYIDFGRFSAKTDDALGWLPARVTAVVYALQGDSQKALTCWKQQAKACSSPNGGVVMTAGAGSLNIQIGGPTYYHGVLCDKKPMGVGVPATWESIPKANQLVTRGSFALSYLWIACVMLGVV